MDWQQRSLQWLQRPQSIALLGGAIAMVGLIAFQTHSLTTSAPPMCELISQCHLRHGDLQRIQVALGESGLNEFQIEGQKLLVPRQHHSKYLQAVSEKDALPMDLRDDRSESISNPLLSRSQQTALKWQRKKRQVKEMILRLPFVQQAWLEIDTAPSSSPFRPSRQSAVISIQPAGEEPLDAQHVDTLRRMISGAVAGLQPEQIEVIDLGEGLAYDRAGEGSAISANRFALNSSQRRQAREQQLENQIETALDRFVGVDVHVKLTPCPIKSAPVSQQATESKPQSKPLVAGSNGVASIFQHESQSADAVTRSGAQSIKIPTIQVSHEIPVHLAEASNPDLPVCRILVHVEVPESALKNVAAPLMLRRPAEHSGNLAIDRIEQKFGLIRPQIEREVASVLPPAWVEASGASPVEVTLRRSSVAPVADQRARLSDLFQKFWPSVAILGVGVLLLSLVTRKSTFGVQDETVDPNILSLSQHRDSNSDAAKNAKESINRMFRDDPDGAAAAIEGWIKKAG